MQQEKCILLILFQLLGSFFFSFFFSFFDIQNICYIFVGTGSEYFSC